MTQQQSGRAKALYEAGTVSSVIARIVGVGTDEITEEALAQGWRRRDEGYEVTTALVGPERGTSGLAKVDRAELRRRLARAWRGTAERALARMEVLLPTASYGQLAMAADKATHNYLLLEGQATERVVVSRVDDVMARVERLLEGGPGCDVQEAEIVSPATSGKGDGDARIDADGAVGRARLPATSGEGGEGSDGPDDDSGASGEVLDPRAWTAILEMQRQLVQVQRPGSEGLAPAGWFELPVRD